MNEVPSFGCYPLLFWTTDDDTRFASLRIEHKNNRTDLIWIDILATVWALLSSTIVAATLHSVEYICSSSII